MPAASRIPDFPAPWNLTGSGLILVLRGLRVLMVVDYQSSNCGPYQELLYIPGKAHIGGQRRYTISDIYVSAMASVVNGRANWGIPKVLADFKRTQNGARVRMALSASARRAGDASPQRPLAEEVYAERPQWVSQGGSEPFFTVDYESYGPSIPISTAYIPGLFTRLGQVAENGTFLYQPFAQGRATVAKIHELKVHDSSLFPAIERKEVLMAFAVEPFAMVFPESEKID